MKKNIISLIAFLPTILWAQSFDFDLTKPQPIYNDQDGFGYDILPAPNEKAPAEPFYFSVKNERPRHPKMPGSVNGFTPRRG
jgi:hypothetical protein